MLAMKAMQAKNAVNATKNIAKKVNGTKQGKQANTFGQLFTMQTNNPQVTPKMAIKELLNMINENKVEVFIKQNEQSVNVTDHFKNMFITTSKPNQNTASLTLFQRTKTDAPSQANATPAKQPSVNDRFIEVNQLPKAKNTPIPENITANSIPTQDAQPPETPVIPHKAMPFDRYQQKTTTIQVAHFPASSIWIKENISVKPEIKTNEVKKDKKAHSPQIREEGTTPRKASNKPSPVADTTQQVAIPIIQDQQVQNIILPNVPTPKVKAKDSPPIEPQQMNKQRQPQTKPVSEKPSTMPQQNAPLAQKPTTSQALHHIPVKIKDQGQPSAVKIPTNMFEAVEPTPLIMNKETTPKAIKHKKAHETTAQKPDTITPQANNTTASQQPKVDQPNIDSTKPLPRAMEKIATGTTFTPKPAATELDNNQQKPSPMSNNGNTQAETRPTPEVFVPVKNVEPVTITTKQEVKDYPIHTELKPEPAKPIMETTSTETVVYEHDHSVRPEPAQPVTAHIHRSEPLQSQPIITQNIKPEPMQSTPTTAQASTPQPQQPTPKIIQTDTPQPAPTQSTQAVPIPTSETTPHTQPQTDNTPQLQSQPSPRPAENISATTVEVRQTIIQSTATTVEQKPQTTPTPGAQNTVKTTPNTEPPQPINPTPSVLAQPMHITPKETIINRGDTMERNRSHLRPADNIGDRQFIMNAHGSFQEVSLPTSIHNNHSTTIESTQLLQDHLSGERPIILSFTSENGSVQSQEVVVDFSSMSDGYINYSIESFDAIDSFSAPMYSVHEKPQTTQTSETPAKPNITQPISQGKPEVKPQNNPQDTSGNHGNPQQDMPNPFDRFDNQQVTQNNATRQAPVSYEALYSKIFTKATQLSSSNQYEAKSVFDVITLNNGKVNVSIEKEGNSLRINLTAETKDKQDSFKNSANNMVENLKQFGFDNVEINIDFNNKSKGEYQAQNDSEGGKIHTLHKQQESTEETEQEQVHIKDYGYNSFEYTA